MYDLGIWLVGFGFVILMFAPLGWQVWGIFAWMFAAMLIWASKYGKEEKGE